MNKPDFLSSELRRLRAERGLSGRAAAAQVGLSQSRLSRIERGSFMPTVDEINELCVLYEAPAKVKRELGEIAKTIREETTSRRAILQRGAWRMSERIRSIEQASGRIRGFQPVIISGLVQTAGYMRGIFRRGTPQDIDVAIKSRLARQEILGSGRDIVVIMSEGALHWNMVSAQVMVEQLNHLMMLTLDPRLRLGIIPSNVPCQQPPLHGFDLYDSRAVIVGTHTATTIIVDSRDISDYEQVFCDLEKLAVFGEAAREVIGSVADKFMNMK